MIDGSDDQDRPPITRRCVGILVGGLDYFWSYKRTRKFKFGRRALIILSLVFLAGSVSVTVRDDLEHRREARELTSRLDALSGGKTYCHVEFDAGANPSSASAMLLHLVNSGDSPVYDVVVQIVDVLEADRIKRSLAPNEAPYAVLQKMFQKTIGTVAAQSAVSLTKDLLRLPERDVAVFEIHIQQRNGTVAQVVRFERVNKAWTFGTKATLLKDSNVLWQQVHSAYPRQNIDKSD